MFEARFGGIRGAGMSRRTGRRPWVVVLLAAAVMLLAIPNLAAGQVAPTPACNVQFFSVTGIFRDLVPGTRGRSDRFSIPRPGQANRLQRYFDVAYYLPTGGCVTVTNVRVDLLNRDGVLLQTVTNSAPGGAGVSVVNDYTYRVRVTFGDGVTSSINSTPPPTDRIRGEHARNIGHRTHVEGRDIDLDHVYTFPGVNATAAGSGGANYTALVRNTNLAFMGDTAARRLVADWASQTRARFDQFIANADVQGRIIYALGSSQPETLDPQGQIVTPQLGRGWARALLERGAYTNLRGQRVDLGIGAWTNPSIATRMLYADDHNDHIHLSVRP